jgi:hypothetical protein
MAHMAGVTAGHQLQPAHVWLAYGGLLMVGMHQIISNVIHVGYNVSEV